MATEDDLLAVAEAARGEWTHALTLELGPKESEDRAWALSDLSNATAAARELARRRKIRLWTDATVQDLSLVLYVRVTDGV